jgi:hypothetical protein
MFRKNQRYSTKGYRKDSPDKHRPVNVINSGRISMSNVPYPVVGTDNLGNSRIMYPNEEHQFPGNQVTEIPIKQKGGINYGDTIAGIRSRQLQQSTIPRSQTPTDYDSKDFFDRVKKDDPLYFQALIQTAKKFGKDIPSVSYTNNRSHYNPVTNNISVDTSGTGMELYTPKFQGMVDTYLEELSHKNQFDNKDAALQWLINDLPEYITGNNPYKDKQALEGEAHSIIAPKIKDYFYNQVDQLQKKQLGGATDLSYAPLFADSIMQALSRRVEDNRQQGYQQLANPLNYLPVIKGQTDQEMYGTPSFQEGGSTEEDDTPDFMGDDWLWEEDPQSNTPTQPLPEEQNSPEPIQEEDPVIPIADQSIWEDQNNDMMPVPPEAYYSQNTTQNFEHIFGNNYPTQLQGNSAAIRNNNPGNIKYGDFAKQFGATDGGLAADGDGSHHAKFPTVEAGINAIGALLQGKGYANLPVYNALNRWITGSPDKPGAYARQVADRVGNKRIADLTPEELRTVVHGMIKGEDVNMAKQLGI